MDFPNHSARQVMVARTRIAGFPADLPVREAMAAVMKGVF